MMDIDELNEKQLLNLLNNKTISRLDEINIYNNLGLLNCDQKETQNKAKYFFNNALMLLNENFNEMKAKDNKVLDLEAGILLNLGNIYITSMDYKQIKFYYDKSLQILRKGVNDKLMAGLLCNLENIYLLNNIKDAEIINYCFDNVKLLASENINNKLKMELSNNLQTIIEKQQLDTEEIKKGLDRIITNIKMQKDK